MVHNDDDDDDDGDDECCCHWFTLITNHNDYHKRHCHYHHLQQQLRDHQIIVKPYHKVAVAEKHHYDAPLFQLMTLRRYRLHRQNLK